MNGHWKAYNIIRILHVIENNIRICNLNIRIFGLHVAIDVTKFRQCRSYQLGTRINWRWNLRLVLTVLQTKSIIVTISELHITHDASYVSYVCVLGSAGLLIFFTQHYCLFGSCRRRNPKPLSGMCTYCCLSPLMVHVISV